MRYVKQRDKFRCGPIAVLNALKWQGLCITGTALDDLNELLACKRRNSSKHSGTYAWKFDRVAKRLGFRRIHKPSVAKLDRALKAGNAVLTLLSAKDKSWGHYSLVTRGTQRMYFVVNVNRKEGHKWMPRSEYHRRRYSSFLAWIVPPLKIGSLIFKPKDQAA